MSDVSLDTGGGNPLGLTPEQLDQLTPELKENMDVVADMMMHEEVGPDGTTTTRRRSLNELSEEELQVLAEFLDDLSLIRGAMKSDVSGTLERIRMAANLGVKMDWDLVDSFTRSSVIQLPPPSSDFDPAGYPEGNSMLNNITATTIFMTLYLRIMAEKDQKEVMRELLVKAIEVFRSYVKDIADHIKEIGKLKAMEHVARAVTQGFQAAGSAVQAGATLRAGKKVDNQIKQQKSEIEVKIKGDTKQDTKGLMGEYESAGGADPNYRHNNSKLDNKGAGDPFNHDTNRLDSARGKPVYDSDANPSKSPAPMKGDIDEGNTAAQNKKKEIDNAVIEHKNLDAQKMPMLNKEVFTYAAYAETYKGTIGALGELAQAGIAIEQSTLEAEKTIIEGAKDLQARLLDTIYQALAESKDEVQKIADYLTPWIQSMGQANPLGANPRG